MDTREGAPDDKVPSGDNTRSTVNLRSFSTLHIALGVSVAATGLC